MNTNECCEVLWCEGHYKNQDSGATKESVQPESIRRASELNRFLKMDVCAADKEGKGST